MAKTPDQLHEETMNVFDDIMRASTTARVVKCRICSAVVPRRKHCHPKMCEACQKFFRRVYERRETLVCLTGQGRCAIEPSSRSKCPKCRYELCQAAGMENRRKAMRSSRRSSFKEKLEPNDDSSSRASNDNNKDGRTSSTTTGDSSLQLVPLHHDPILYDGSAMETDMKHIMSAFAMLHGLEFLSLKLKNAITDWRVLAQGGLEHSAGIIKIGQNYCHDLAMAHGLTSVERDSLEYPFVSASAYIYLALPNSDISSRRFGMHDNNVAMMLRWFPSFSEPITINEQLCRCLTAWNPTFIECGLLMGLLFYNENSLNFSKLTEIRLRLWSALDLYYQRQVLQGNLSAEQITIRKQYFFEAIQYSRLSAQAIRSFLLSNQMPHFQACATQYLTLKSGAQQTTQ